MSRHEEDGLNECDFCGELWMCCECREEDLPESCLDSKSNKKYTNHTEVTITSKSIPKIIDGAEVQYTFTERHTKEI